MQEIIIEENALIKLREVQEKVKQRKSATIPSERANTSNAIRNTAMNVG